jgi:tRNA threonylcarbamoyladenosine biosynthesis protein TsaE
LKLKVDELDTLCKFIVSKFESGVVILDGTLASGKTTLVKEFVKYLEIDEDVTSPTFSLQHRYGDKVYHYDIYNKGLDNFLAQGLLDELERDGYHFVEWGGDELKKLLDKCGIDSLHVKININKDYREYIVA